MRVGNVWPALVSRQGSIFKKVNMLPRKTLLNASQRPGKNKTRRSAAIRVKARMQPLFGPAYALCMGSCEICGLVLEQSLWHWPTWVRILAGAPLNLAAGLILTGLVVIPLQLRKDQKRFQTSAMQARPMRRSSRTCRGRRRREGWTMSKGRGREQGWTRGSSGGGDE